MFANETKRGMVVLRSLLSLLLCVISFYCAAAQLPVEQSAQSVFRVLIARNVPGSAITDDEKQRLKSSSMAVVKRKGKIFLVFTQGSKYYDFKSHGSGFVINQTQMITNHHVIEPLLNDTSTVGFIVIGDGVPLNLRKFTVKFYDKDKDYAVLDVDGLKGKPLAISGVTLHKSQSVYSIGFPGNSDQIGINGNLDDIDSYLDKGFFESKARRGSVSTSRSIRGFKDWEHTAPISGGNSGGPLVNECGEVVGVNTFIHEKDNNVGIALSIDEVFSRLKAEGVDFSQTTTECVVEDSLPDWVIYLLIAVAISLSIVIASVIHLKQQVQKGINPYPDSKSYSKAFNYAKKISEEVKANNDINWQKDDHGREFYLHPFDGIIYKADLEKQSAPKANENVNKDSEQPIGLIKLGLNGAVIAQKHIYLNQRLVIGASKKADLTLDKDEISSRHLEISANDKGLFVKDLNSTNGSYINGKKMSQQLNVSGNTRVSLSSASHEYYVDIVLSGAAVAHAPQELILKSVGKNHLPTIHLPVGLPVLIGRSDDVDIRLDDQEYKLSNQHCRLLATSNNTLVVEDTNSTNGVFVDSLENRVKKVEIVKGKVIYLADDDFAYLVV